MQTLRSHAEDITNTEVNIFDSDKQKREAGIHSYENNFRSIYENISGAWFSFGDEALMKKAFHEFASSAHGQQTIANLSPDVEIESGRMGKSRGVMATFLMSENGVRMNSSVLQERSLPDVVSSLSHELLHAKQERLGFMDMDGLTPRQAMKQGLLLEAETASWDMTLGCTNMLFKTTHPKKEDVRDLLAKSPQELEQFFDEKRALLLQSGCSKQDADSAMGLLRNFYSDLKQSNGSVYAAQKKSVGRTMNFLMNSDEMQNSMKRDWKSTYEEQSLNNMSADTSRFTSKGKPNKNADKYHDYLKKEYGVSADQIDLSLSRESQDSLERIEKDVASQEYLSSARLQAMNGFAQIRSQQGGR